MNLQNDTLRNANIILCGPSDLQNSLISQYLSTNLSSNCRCYTDIPTEKELEQDHLLPLNMMLLEANQNMLVLWQEMVKKYELYSGQTFPVVIFNAERDFELDKHVIKRVRGVFYKDDNLDLFLKGLLTITKGEYWFSSHFLINVILSELQNCSELGRMHTLTQREMDILNYLVNGFDNNEIADELCLSYHTVKNHFTSIFKKIDVKNRMQAILWAKKYLSGT